MPVLLACLLGWATSAIAAEAQKGQDEWQRVVEAAKKEGQLTLYGSPDFEGLFGEFHKKYPEIEVTGAIQSRRRRGPSA